jgi:hypothetical protein
MMKSKSSDVSTVFILVTVAFDFFREEVFGEETFLFFRGSMLSFDSITSPCFFSSPVPFISSSSPPRLGDIEAIFLEGLLRSWTYSVFFILLGLGVSRTIFGLLGSDISAGSAGMRRYVDQSLVISSRSSSVSL